MNSWTRSVKHNLKNKQNSPGNWMNQATVTIQAKKSILITILSSQSKQQKQSQEWFMMSVVTCYQWMLLQVPSKVLTMWVCVANRISWANFKTVYWLNNLTRRIAWTHHTRTDQKDMIITISTLIVKQICLSRLIWWIDSKYLGITRHKWASFLSITKPWMQTYTLRHSCQVKK